MISLNQNPLSSIEKILVDGGYTGKKFSDTVKALCEAEVEVVKRSEQHHFQVLPKRWIVERSFGWLENTVDFGKTVKEKSILHCRWQFWPSFRSASKDFKQALSVLFNHRMK